MSRKIAVFGSGGDIGRAIVKRLEKDDAHVREFSHEACDVTNPERVRSAFGSCWSYSAPGLDGVVICHGAPSVAGRALDLTPEEFRNVMDIDVLGTFIVCQAASRYLIAKKSGHIVVVSSMQAIAPYPERAAYAAAKAGVCGLVRALAVEWAQYGIYVNAVLPGQVDGTRRTDRHATEPRAKERSPSGEFVSLDAVSAAVCFLLESSGINGHSLVVDDGWTVYGWYGPHT